jgi:S-DNA-T family DNA segregation ATPase FtsK/SpoIIIE
MQQERAAYLKSNFPAEDVPEAAGFEQAIKESVVSEDERLIQECVRTIRREKVASTSILQRRLRLGYRMAAGFLEELEWRGVVGPVKRVRPRDILIDLK